MNLTKVVLLVTVLVTVVVAARYFKVGGAEVQPVVERQNPQDRTVPSIDEPAVSIPSAEEEKHSTGSNNETNIDDPYINPEFVEYVGKDDSREFQDRFFVIPRSSDQECEQLKSDTGLAECWNQSGYHPYFAYDLDTLKALAESDAAAAEILGRKLQNARDEAALYWLVRAAALSNKPGPLVRYVKTQGVAIDGQRGVLPNPEDALMLLAVATAVDAMGYPYRQSPEIEATLLRYGVTASDIEIARQAGYALLGNPGGEL